MALPTNSTDGGNNHHVSMLDRRQEFIELRSVGSRAAELLAKHALASGGLQLAKLAGEVLGVGRDAGVAVNHAPIWTRKITSDQRVRFGPKVLSFCSIPEAAP